jgi:hypothetical protein
MSTFISFRITAPYALYSVLNSTRTVHRQTVTLPFRDFVLRDRKLGNYIITTKIAHLLCLNNV